MDSQPDLSAAGAAQLSLDFANTLSERTRPAPLERLGSYADLVAWGQEAGLLNEAEAATLRRQAAGDPARAAAALAQAVTLREALYRIFSAVAAGRTASPTDVATLNQGLAAAPRVVVPLGSGCGWGWHTAREALERLIPPIAQSAADLLIDGDVARVRECADDQCGWLFMDRSRNRSRRWCDMSDCGNRAKARRHYARTRETTRVAEPEGGR